MAPNPVAAKEGGMKDYAEGCGIYVERWKGEMVERFPRNKSHPTPKQVHQVIFCVIPGKRTLDPGSSLLETPVERWKWRFSDRQYKVAALAIAPFGIAVHGGGWQSPFATETGGLFQAGNSVASAERTSATLILHQSATICAFYPRISA